MESAESIGNNIRHGAVAENEFARVAFVLFSVRYVRRDKFTTRAPNEPGYNIESGKVCAHGRRRRGERGSGNEETTLIMLIICSVQYIYIYIRVLPLYCYNDGTRITIHGDGGERSIS